MMVAVEEKCEECGEIFLREIFPQKICEQCEMKKPTKVYSYEQDKERVK